MNTKMQHLVEQCQIEIHGIHGELLNKGFDSQLFAELIVKECVEAFHTTRLSSTSLEQHIKNRLGMV